MNILKIFGLVVAVHAAAFMLLFAIPGCRSTGPRPPTAADTQPAAASPGIAYPVGASPVAASGYAADGSSSMTNADLNPGVSPVASPVESGSGIRFNPTRPGTPAATVLQTAPVDGVTAAKTYVVVKNDSLWTVARKHHLSVEELAAVNNLKTGATLQVGRKLIIPAKGAATSATSAAARGAGDTLTYKVGPNQTLSEIAHRSGTTVATIKALNKLKSDIVHVGQELILPAGGTTAAALAAADAGADRKVSRAPANAQKHTVRPGETLDQIARMYGVSSRDLGVANHIADPRTLAAGREITIPAGKGKAPSTAAATPSPAATEPAASFAPASPVSPVSSSSSPDASPISAPSTSEPPPVIKVEESSPVGAATP